MKSLIDAAKAVIERWEKLWINAPLLSYAIEENRRVIGALKAAVERAEKQEAVGFDEWMKAYMDDGPDYPPSAIHGWIAAQQAERERCREIVITMGGPDVPELLRKIDSGED